ncbi:MULTISPECIES: AzlD family protein [unclassified Nitratireductor]|uniref:AzlD family protein n=1 Tax=unclassified Nitratireductor TaxID=2641084 RepID=UPI0025F32DAA|nr:AzlD family protein [Nitratireductor sp.]
MSTTVWIILAGAVLTFLTRIGGHMVLSRFERIHPRVEAGLNAVPAAVLTTLVAPAAMNGGIPEIAALTVGVVVSLVAGGMMPMFLSSAAVLILLRHLIGQ